MASIDFHRPSLGTYSPERYVDDAFTFMRDSKTIDESKSKSIFYELEMVSLHPCILGEDIESLFVNKQLTNLCYHSGKKGSGSSLDLLVFIDKSTPIGYLNLMHMNSRLQIIDLRLVDSDDSLEIISGIIRVLGSWIFEHLGIEDLEVELSSDCAKQILVSNKLIIKESSSNQESTKIIFRARPIEPKDVTLILTAGPSITPVERNFASKAVAFGWNAHHSDFISEFEGEFARYVGAKYAMATSSCTGALHLSLLALNIGPGDEVIVPDITWVATASVISYVGAIPVFADIDAKSWTLDPNSVERLISAKTKAIIPVHLYGYAANIEPIMQLARKNNLYVIEDAAPAIGTLIKSRAAGTFGDFGCYSFQGAKMLVTGEGGMIVTDSELLYTKVKKLQDHGRVPGSFWIDTLGRKYKISNVAASIGLAQLTSVERQIERKREINAYYTEKLAVDSRVKFQEEILGSRSICWMTSITLENVSRNDLFSYLKYRGVDTRPTFPTISSYPIWGDKVKHESKNSSLVGEFGVNLPSGINLTREKLSHVSDAVLDFLREL